MHRTKLMCTALFCAHLAIAPAARSLEICALGCVDIPTIPGTVISKKPSDGRRRIRYCRGYLGQAPRAQQCAVRSGSGWVRALGWCTGG